MVAALYHKLAGASMLNTTPQTGQKQGFAAAAAAAEGNASHPKSQFEAYCRISKLIVAFRTLLYFHF